MGKNSDGKSAETHDELSHSMFFVSVFYYLFFVVGLYHQGRLFLQALFT